MRSFGWLVAGGVLVVGLGACASTGEHAAANGTVVGTVVAGPTCPVERLNSPCPPTPVAGAAVVAQRATHQVAHTVTDSHGSFRLSLEPGSYTLIATNVGPYASTDQASVVVRSAATATVTLTIDTGIR